METANNYIYFWEICFVSLLCIASVDAECNVCQGNQAACINSTHFYLCFGESTPNTDNLYHCKDGFDCTDLNAICVQANNARRPSCGDTALCGLCSAHRNYLFACTSRTTFQMCYGATHPSGQVGYCPQGFVCDADSDTICVNSTQPHEITCDILEAPETTPTSNSQGIATTTETTPATPSTSPMPSPTPSPSPMPSPTPMPSPMPSPTPSPMPSPTPSPSPMPSPTPMPSPMPSPTPMPMPSPTPSPIPSPMPSSMPSPTPSPMPSSMPSPTPSPMPSPSPTPTPMTPDQVCAERRRFGLFPIVPSDPNCTRYISCYYSNDLVRGHENSCPPGTYFNMDREQCTLQKPSYCP